MRIQISTENGSKKEKMLNCLSSSGLYSIPEKYFKLREGFKKKKKSGIFQIWSDPPTPPL